MTVRATPSPRPAEISAICRIVLAASSFLVVAGACLLVARHADAFAAQLAPATCVKLGCYCEADAISGPREPVDAWSSLAPAAAASILLATLLGRRPVGGTELTRSRVPSALLALAASSIALFSFHYHATHTLLGEWLDAVSLYLLAGFGIAWGIARTRRLSARGFTVAYAVTATLPATLAWLVPSTRKVAFVVVAAAAIAVELVGRRRRSSSARGGYLAAALGLFAAAGVAWTLDWTRLVCDPQSLVQLHAVWHLLSAPTIVALHAYYLSERPAVATTTDAGSGAHHGGGHRPAAGAGAGGASSPAPSVTMEAAAASTPGSPRSKSTR